MPKRVKPEVAAKFVEEWALSPAATFGSSVRAKGILLEARAKSSSATKKMLGINGMVLSLRMPEGADADFRHAFTVVSTTLEGIENLPVIPREVEDILAISSTERHRWLKDGRLQSAGTRTVKLRGRARQITFHVFDPHHIEDVLDRDLVNVWREDDAMTAAENRRRASGKAALARARKSKGMAPSPSGSTGDDAELEDLRGWGEFKSDGFLR